MFIYLFQVDQTKFQRFIWSIDHAVDAMDVFVVVLNLEVLHDLYTKTHYLLKRLKEEDCENRVQ